jgi:hypothetical protein
MKQHQVQSQTEGQQGQTLSLKRVELDEVVAQAYYIRMRLRKKGRTTRRITVPLPARKIPGFHSGEFSTGFGLVRVKVSFSQEEGRWFITVILPPEDGFQLKDVVRQTPPKLSPEEMKELEEVVERLWAK